MRISDWSSDVCSSDLPDPLLDRVAIGEHLFEVGVFKAKRPGQLVKAAVVLELAQVVAAPRAPPHHMMAIDPRAKCREHRREPFSGVHVRLLDRRQASAEGGQLRVATRPHERLQLAQRRSEEHTSELQYLM